MKNVPIKITLFKGGTRQRKVEITPTSNLTHEIIPDVWKSCERIDTIIPENCKSDWEVEKRELLDAWGVANAMFTRLLELQELVNAAESVPQMAGAFRRFKKGN